MLSRMRTLLSMLQHEIVMLPQQKTFAFAFAQCKLLRMTSCQLQVMTSCQYFQASALGVGGGAAKRVEVQATDPEFQRCIQKSAQLSAVAARAS
jgi:hypothetical protein